jgi:uncharacterized phiE125 gp8 family phage protein
MGLSLVSKASTDPVVSLSEAKQHLNVEHTLDDDLITSFLRAAEAHAEGWTGRRFVSQVVDWSLDAFPPCRSWSDPLRGELLTPVGPIRSVDQITYVDESGATQTLAASAWQADVTGDLARIQPAYATTWPSTRPQTLGAVTVRLTVGYAPSADSPPDYTANVPYEIKVAIKQLVAHWYSVRESVNVGNIVSQIPMGTEALLNGQRIWSF